MSAPVYLDYNATTPVDPAVREAMLPYLGEHFGNPSSSHAYGRRAREAVEAARAEVAALIGAQTDEVVFTGCATEANNLAIQGVARALRAARRHLITSAVEHPAVARPCERLAEDGWDLTVLPVDGHGRVDPDAAARALREDTALVTVMHANNEVARCSRSPRSPPVPVPGRCSCPPTRPSRWAMSRWTWRRSASTC
jgi:cysteine desulfurase